MEMSNRGMVNEYEAQMRSRSRNKYVSCQHSSVMWSNRVGETTLGKYIEGLEKNSKQHQHSRKSRGRTPLRRCDQGCKRKTGTAPCKSKGESFSETVITGSYST